MPLHWTTISSIDALPPHLQAQLEGQDRPNSGIEHGVRHSAENIDGVKYLSGNDDKNAANTSSPFLSFAFLSALESSGCVGDNTGWIPQHIIIYQSDDSKYGPDTYLEGDIIAFLPCYLKTHSYGEYVFDHAWANAYQQHQVPYYPKLVCCVPFSPVTGARWLQNSEYQNVDVPSFIKTHVSEIIHALGASSFHILFPPQAASDSLAKKTFLQRFSVQFNWYNKDYANFDDFMAKLTSRKRRMINKERTSIAKQGVSLHRYTGEQISPQVLGAFLRCYQQTYIKRSGHLGYLNQAFFEALVRHMPEQIMIVGAQQNDEIIASALFVFNHSHLFGRYWGSLVDVSGLHFECCYYQGIEFAIEHKITTFNPGTQGEHKILRGFEPTYCYSNHYLAHPDFHRAVADFLTHEATGIATYKANAMALLPFKESL